MLMAQSRWEAFEHFLKPQTFLPLIVALTRSVHPISLRRKRGEIARTRTTILQAHTHQWLGTFGNAGNGDYRGELLRARAVITSYATSLSLPLSHILMRLDGLYGNAAPLADLLVPGGPGVIVRGETITC